MNKDKIIKVFRSREALADGIGVKVRTVKDWFDKGKIPPDRHRDILESFANVTAPESIRLTGYDLDEVSA